MQHTQITRSLTTGRRSIIAGVAALAFTLAGCSAPQWADEWITTVTTPPSARTTSTPESSDSVSSSVTETSQAPEVVDNDDFPTGSATHRVTAGALELDISYWTSLPRDQWSAEAVKPLSVSVTTSSTQDVTVTGMSFIVEPRAGGTAVAAAEIRQEARLPQLGALIDAPTTYSWTAAIPAVDENVTALRVIALLEISIPGPDEGSPTVVQTATDELVITLSGEHRG